MNKSKIPWSNVSFTICISILVHAAVLSSNGIMATCDPGSYFDGGSCEPCPAGSYGLIGYDCYSCTTFGNQFYQDEPGQMICKYCSFGSVNSDQTACEACSAGSMAMDGSCEPCLPCLGFIKSLKFEVQLNINQTECIKSLTPFSRKLNRTVK